mgnify:CR=1 FL=1
MILDTFEAASRNDLARANIASRLATKEIDRGQAERELRALPNPMEAFREFRKQSPDLVGQAIKESGRVDDEQRNPPPRGPAPAPQQAQPRPVTSGQITATHPQTGKKLMLTPNGTWEPFDG